MKNEVVVQTMNEEEIEPFPSTVPLGIHEEVRKHRDVYLSKALKYRIQRDNLLEAARGVVEMHDAWLASSRLNSSCRDMLDSYIDHMYEIVADVDSSEE